LCLAQLASKGLELREAATLAYPDGLSDGLNDERGQA
jgi:hypothetical protein